MDSDPRWKILLVEDEEFRIQLMHSKLQKCSNLSELVDNVFPRYGQYDTLHIYVGDHHIDALLNLGILEMKPVKCITLCFDCKNKMSRVESELTTQSPKLKFCLKREVENRIRNQIDSEVLHTVPCLNTSSLGSNLARNTQIVKMKMNQIASQKLRVPQFSSTNVDQKYFCGLCSSILFEPVRLICEHHICKACEENHNE